MRKCKDELTKNHRGMENLVSGFMCENPGDRLCPVRSYKMYLDHLEPCNSYMWQTPNTSAKPKNPEIWYTKGNIGKNPLAKFMSDISEKCNLSMISHNHSIRVTGITMLTRMQFSASEIMSVSGHKSVQSLANYQKTCDTQKIQMADGLYQSMTRKENQIHVESRPALRPILPKPQPDVTSEKQQKSLPAPSVNTPEKCQPAVQNKENSNKEIVPFEADFSDVPDFDLLSVLADINKETSENCEKASSIQNQVDVTTTTTNTNILNNVPKSFFSNCTIGNIHFHIHK